MHNLLRIQPFSSFPEEILYHPLLEKKCNRDLFFTSGMVGSLTGSPVPEVSPAPQNELRHETLSRDNFAGIGLFTRKKDKIDSIELFEQLEYIIKVMPKQGCLSSIFNVTYQNKPVFGSVLLHFTCHFFELAICLSSPRRKKTEMQVANFSRKVSRSEVFHPSKRDGKKKQPTLRV